MADVIDLSSRRFREQIENHEIVPFWVADAARKAAGLVTYEAGRRGFDLEVVQAHIERLIAEAVQEGIECYLGRSSLDAFDVQPFRRGSGG